MVYTDGSSLGNPGPGGLGIVLLYLINGEEKKKMKFYEGYKLTTNNRMELLAVIRALQLLNDNAYLLPITIYTDSKYVSDAFNKKWLDKWISKSFKNVKNSDLWRQLITLLPNFKNIKFVWVKGHNNNFYNELSDKLAKFAASKANKIDEGYLKSLD